MAVAISANGRDHEPMGLYNLLLAELECPRCLVRARCAVEFRLGLLDLREYRLGDILRWAGGHRGKPLRRPDEGTADGEGYCECAHCGKDFWVRVHVRDDRIAEVRPDADRPAHIS
ncbi:hypothetical protein HII36_17260 [Nonomuraea sp. NN258]|uniref:hypothetical protein n=1 Tax=Nonomuraea antri TaxID=2730852 RepID=UPI0015698C53|nr:hypothetical protein [Nonomuraea antri]NRQ33584.1 hypothetical protein [Nonomuraea antri]